MKKVLSILMVAVLSLNLLYQPCMAAETDVQTKVGESRKSSSWSVIGGLICAYILGVCGATCIELWAFESVDQEDGRGRIFLDGACAVMSPVSFFPVQKLSKKCLGQTLSFFNSTDFKCSNETQEFYANIQKAYDKKK